MEFENVKYQHVERWDTDETEYLKNSEELFIQPKLDGTNGLLAFENGKLLIGSRNRFITIDNDNQGFAKYIEDNKDRFLNYFNEHPTHVLYGEFLINHVFKVKPVYVKNFYVFDVYDRVERKYLYPDEYTKFLDINNISYVPTYHAVNKDIESLCKNDLKDFGRFLLEDSFEMGEGFVIKDFNPNHANRYGRITWAKILNEKPHEAGKDLFSMIREKFFTDAWIEKETIKYNERFQNEKFNFMKYSNLMINEFIKEECANIVIKFKYPRISFQELKVFLNNILKEYIDGRQN